ncbi:MAG: class I tRNA ligase family protein [Chloroflexi bacterium]|nr:class I tRNA ligase family protein [Chloroflexota bacterium]
MASHTHRVIAWKEVGAEEGTGIVHIAPGCGAEDFALGKEFNLPVIAPLDENGIYKEGSDWLVGQSAHDVGLQLSLKILSRRACIIANSGTRIVIPIVGAVAASWFIDW